jgi:hypothetical protein
MVARHPPFGEGNSNGCQTPTVWRLPGLPDTHRLEGCQTLPGTHRLEGRLTPTVSHRLARGIPIAANHSECGCLEPLLAMHRLNVAQRIRMKLRCRRAA